MRIEIDTKHDTKEELEHLGKMLMALSGSKPSTIFRQDRQDRPKHRDLFSDEPAQPSGGLFNMFGSSPVPESEPIQPVGMMSIFDSSPAPTPEERKEPEVKDLVDGLRIIPY